MTAAEAARLLDLPPDATPAQLEARFLELRARLEDKIAKAPTPGLKEKYRGSLADITTAFEQLTLAADGGSLPVLERVTASGVGASVADARPASSASAPRPVQPVTKTKSNREFLIVALIAVLVLGIGGWWIVKTRSENTERARVEAEQKVEAEKQAQLAKAEAERLAAKKQRFELEERAKQEAEFARLRAAQAELKIRWEAIEREANLAERRLSELRGDARGMDNKPASPEQAELRARLAAQNDYIEWLQPTLARHPARTLLARLDALLSAKAMSEAAKSEVELVEVMTKSETELAEQRAAFLTLTSPVELISTPAGLKTTVVDAFGRSRDLITPTTVELPYGELSILTRGPSGWPDKRQDVRLTRGQILSVKETFDYGTLRIESEPAGLEFTLDNGQG
jgi:DNA primase